MDERRSSLWKTELLLAIGLALLLWNAKWLCDWTSGVPSRPITGALLYCFPNLGRNSPGNVALFTIFDDNQYPRLQEDSEDFGALGKAHFWESNSTSKPQRASTLDLRTGHLRKAAGRWFPHPERKQGVYLSWDTVADMPRMQPRWRVQWFDGSTMEPIHTSEFDVPYPADALRWLDYRTLTNTNLSHQQDRVLIFDVWSHDAKPHEIALPAPLDSEQAKSVPVARHETPNLRRVSFPGPFLATVSEYRINGTWCSICYLMKVDDHGHEIIHRWVTPGMIQLCQSVTAPDGGGAGPALVTVSESFDTILHYSKVDGKLQREVPLEYPNGFAGTPNGGVVFDGYACIQYREGRLYFDLESGDLLYHQMNDSKPCQIIPDLDLCIIHDWEGHELRAIELGTNRETWRFKLENSLFQWLSADREKAQLIVASSKRRFDFIDAETGQVVRTIEPEFWVLYLTAAELIGGILWIVWWMRYSVKRRIWAWIDGVLIGLIVAGVFIYRIFATSNLEDAGLPSYQVLEGISAGWMILTAAWLALGKARLSLRVLPVLAVAAITVGMCIALAGPQHPQNWQVVFSGGMLLLAMLGILLVIRYFGFALRPNARREEPVATTSKAIPLRDLFAVTAGIALVLAAVRHVKWPEDLNDLIYFVLLTFSFLIVTLTSAWLALGRSRGWARVITFGLGICTATVLLPIYLEWYYGSGFPGKLDFHFRLFGSTALLLLLALIPYRLRGYALGFQSR